MLKKCVNAPKKTVIFNSTPNSFSNHHFMEYPLSLLYKSKYKKAWKPAPTPKKAAGPPLPRVPAPLVHPCLKPSALTNATSFFLRHPVPKKASVKAIVRKIHQSKTRFAIRSTSVFAIYNFALDVAIFGCAQVVTAARIETFSLHTLCHICIITFSLLQKCIGARFEKSLI